MYTAIMREKDETSKIISADRLENQIDAEFYELLKYIDNLAQHKLGYPVSLLTYLGVVDNRVLGIQPNSLANILLNNVGDPFKDSETSLMEVKRHERLLIMILERYFGLAKDSARGYVTTGGTEGNFASIWWSKRYLINSALDALIKQDDIIKQQLKEEQDLISKLAKISLNDYKARAEQLQKIMDVKQVISENRDIVQQLLTPTVFFAKGHTHYSIPKIAEVSRLNIKPVQANSDGSLNLNELRKELLFHLGSHPHSAIIVVANIGTTITGAIDDVPGIKKILDELRPKPLHTIHMDGALTGFVLPIIKPFGDVPDYFDALGVNTLAVSAHKYPGLSQPCGIILATKHFFDRAFEKSERSIDYVGNILDVTITGSRSGLNVLMFYNALRTMQLDKNNDKLTEMVKENLDHAAYLRDQLINIFGPEKVNYPYHFNVIFPRPSKELAKKYQLMLTGDVATICVLTNATKELIDRFIVDLKLDLIQQTKENNMTKTTQKSTQSGKKEDFTIRTLGREHMQDVKKLFIKTFCDHEPITKHLGVQYDEYEPFVMEVIQKAVKDGLSVVALDNNNHIIACAIAEDITDPFMPHPELYPKLKPIFALIKQLDEPFMKGKHFKSGKISHSWIAMVDRSYQGHGLSTAIDLACTNLAASKGYDFTYAEFTNTISEKIVNHYSVAKKLEELSYDDFTFQGSHPFEGVKGGAATYILGIRPNVTIDTLKSCYTAEA